MTDRFAPRGKIEGTVRAYITELERQLEEARRRLREMSSIRYGCSGLDAKQVEEWFRCRADDALAALAQTEEGKT